MIISEIFLTFSSGDLAEFGISIYQNMVSTQRIQYLWNESFNNFKQRLQEVVSVFDINFTEWIKFLRVHMTEDDDVGLQIEVDNIIPFNYSKYFLYFPRSRTAPNFFSWDGC